MFKMRSDLSIFVCFDLAEISLNPNRSNPTLKAKTSPIPNQIALSSTFKDKGARSVEFKEIPINNIAESP